MDTRPARPDYSRPTVMVERSPSVDGGSADRSGSAARPPAEAATGGRRGDRDPAHPGARTAQGEHAGQASSSSVPRQSPNVAASRAASGGQTAHPGAAAAAAIQRVAARTAQGEGAARGSSERVSTQSPNVAALRAASGAATSASDPGPRQRRRSNGSGRAPRRARTTPRRRHRIRPSGQPATPIE